MRRGSNTNDLSRRAFLTSSLAVAGVAVLPSALHLPGSRHRTAFRLFLTTSRCIGQPIHPSTGCWRHSCVLRLQLLAQRP